MTSKSNDKLDILELFVFVYSKRRRLITLLIIGVALSVVYSFLMEKKYQADIVFIPQTNSSSGGSGLGQLSGIASFAGISLGSSENTEITPSLYPNLLENIKVQDKLLNSKLYLSNYGDSVSLRYYYDSIYLPSPLGVLNSYTIGLPKRVLNGLRGTESSSVNIGNSTNPYRKITHQEYGLINRLKQQIRIVPNERSGVVTIVAEMSVPELSAQLAGNMMKILKDELISYKIDKAKQEYEYVLSLYEEKNREYLTAQEALGTYKDNNVALTTARSQTRLQNLQSETDLAYNVFNSLAQRLEDAKIKLQKETPTLTILKPIVIPLHAEISKKKVVTLTFFVLSLVLVLSTIVIHYLGPFLSQLKSKI